MNFPFVGNAYADSVSICSDVLRNYLTKSIYKQIMRKKLLSLALIAAMFGSFSISAENANETKWENNCNIENCGKKDGKKVRAKNGDCEKQGCKKSDCKKKECKNDSCSNKPCNKQSRKHEFKNGRQDVINENVIFETLNLTPEQSAKITALGEAREESRWEYMKSLRQARAEGDTAIKFDVNAAREISRKYLGDLRTILTADQYMQFLEGNYINNQRASFGKGHHDFKDSKRVKNSVANTECTKDCKVATNDSRKSDLSKKDINKDRKKAGKKDKKQRN